MVPKLVDLTLGICAPLRKRSLEGGGVCSPAATDGGVQGAAKLIFQI